MTKKESERLHNMQKNYPLTTDNTLETLWEIGDIAGIHHICSYQMMFTEIMVSTQIDTYHKGCALRIFEKWAYTRGRLDERRETGYALNTAWFEGCPKD